MNNNSKIARFKSELDISYNLPQSQIDFFRQNGYIKLKNIFSLDVLNYYGDIITEWVVKLNQNTLPMEQRDTYQKAFLQIFNLWYKNDTIKEFVFSQKLARIATELLGVSGVRIYHDQALYKEPSGGNTPWHVDQYYWPLSNENTVTAWIPLQETPQEMGPLCFAAGSHKVDIGRSLEISDESEQYISKQLSSHNFPYENSAFDLGEVSFHYGWTFHNAGANQSSYPRKVMTIIYMDEDMKMVKPTNQHQLEDWERWISGTKIGETINTSMNPILYTTK